MHPSSPSQVLFSTRCDRGERGLGDAFWPFPIQQRMQLPVKTSRGNRLEVAHLEESLYALPFSFSFFISSLQ
jgi:hypothetical protein